MTHPATKRTLPMSTNPGSLFGLLWRRLPCLGVVVIDHALRLRHDADPTRLQWRQLAEQPLLRSLPVACGGCVVSKSKRLLVCLFAGERHRSLCSLAANCGAARLRGLRGLGHTPC